MTESGPRGMARVSFVALGLVLALSPASSSAAPAPDGLGRWSLDVGVIGTSVPGVSGGDLDLLMGVRADQPLPARAVRVSLRLRGRARFELLAPALRATRWTELGVLVQPGRVQVQLGRSPVPGGAWRLVDGVVATGRLGRVLRLGGWFGLLPELWSTAPSADRVGGGPLFAVDLPRFDLELAGEIAVALGGATLGAGPPAVDRASVVVRAVGQPVSTLHVGGRADVQGRRGGPVSVADAGAWVQWRFSPGWDLQADGSVFSSLAALATLERDASLRRWALVSPLDLPAADLLDRQHHAAASLRLRRRPGEAAPEPLGGELAVRYRHHPEAANRWLQARLQLGAYGLGVLDVQGEGAFVWSDGRPRVHGGVRAWLEPVDRLSVELALLGIADVSGKATPTHGAVTQVWLMVRATGALHVSAGWELDVGHDGLGASPHTEARHTAFVRAGLRHR